MKSFVVLKDYQKGMMSRDMRVSMDLVVVHDDHSGFSVTENKLDGQLGLIDEEGLANLLKSMAVPDTTVKPEPGSIEQSMVLIAQVFQDDLRFKALAQVDNHAREALAMTGAEVPPPVRVA